VDPTAMLNAVKILRQKNVTLARIKSIMTTAARAVSVGAGAVQ
jgi:hypothetical protein